MEALTIIEQRKTLVSLLCTDINTLKEDTENFSLWEKIQNIQLDRVSIKIIEDENWTEKETEIAIDAYRTFLFLLATNKDKIITPFRFVDIVWHQHILESIKKYGNDCKDSIGFIPDHKFRLHNEYVPYGSVHMESLTNWSFDIKEFSNSKCDGAETCEFSM